MNFWDHVSEKKITSPENEVENAEPSIDEFAKMAQSVQHLCQVGSISARGFIERPDDNYERNRYEGLRDQAVTLVLQIHDGFLQGFAIHQLAKLCREANQVSYVRPFFAAIEDEFIRSKIMEDVPELEEGE
ncbi:hypothetical protein GCM10007853_29070 [Algimonas ampicilliniresistens]|uniref:Uncharacterized protein n=1 Tax=Algimonas ampicilliniresistens TaxID=1298735 RepID=A0ABQ5VCA4_9PROT|nr:hypothetical protein [Algimonas ampicilliniresistens]GLQ25033.1 hypothetical protein GCM10007853_29070 [Algimonas ampicilliniresistens]